MNEKPNALEMRLGGSFLKTVDEWRRKQKDLPSRVEAIRRLVERGLANRPPPVSSARVPNTKQPRWRAEKSTALAIRLQLAKNEHDESASSSKGRENFAIFATKQKLKPTLNKENSAGDP